MRSLEQLTVDAAPFPDSTIEQLPKTAKRPALDYVAWPHYNQRLLLHHPSHSWEVFTIVESGGTWAVAGHLTIEGVRYAGVGEDATPTAAESNAYKRAAAHAGIGLHLYGGYWLYGRLEKDATDE